MNFKIIETASTLPDVLLFRDIDDSGSQIVEIKSVGTIDNQSDMFASEIVLFNDSDSAQSFIRDFSEFSANKWCQKQKITY